MKKPRLVIFVALTISIFPLIASAQSGLDQRVAELSQQISKEMTLYQKTAIAVVEFTDLRGAVTDFGRFLAEELITRLFQSKKFKVIERQLLNKILAEQALSLTGVIDPNSAKQIGRVLGVDAIVSGTVTDLAQSLRVNARLISTQSGKIFAVASTEIFKDESVIKLMIQQKPKARDDRIDKNSVTEKPSGLNMDQTFPIHTRIGDYLDFMRVKSEKTSDREWNCKEVISGNICMLDDWAGRRDVMLIHPINQSNPGFLETTFTIPIEGSTSLVISLHSHESGDFDAEVIARDLDGNIISLLGRRAIKPSDGWVEWSISLDRLKGEKVTLTFYAWPSGWYYEFCYVDKFYILNKEL